VAIIFNYFPDNQLFKSRCFAYIVAHPGFSFTTPLNLYEASRFIPPIGWTPLPRIYKIERAHRSTRHCNPSKTLHA